MAEALAYDYIIIGSGSAGSVLAYRLGARPEHRILVLEAGGPDRFYDWKIQMPAAFAYPLMQDKVNWAYHSEPDPFMDGRSMYCPRGRVVGGSSSINGMVYIRGHARDYDHWAQLGLKGWSYAEILPYFRRAESRDLGADDYHGAEGPLHVSRGHSPQPLFKAWVEAGRQAGYPMTSDLNGYQQEGLGPMDMTTWRGRRWSAAKAYLRPAMARGNVDARNPGAHAAPRLRRAQGRGRRVFRRRPAATGARQARGDRLGRRHQLAPDSHAFRRRSGR